MKASEVIRAALKDFYIVDKEHYDGKHQFMCHAIHYYIRQRDNVSYSEARETAYYVIDTFMPIIEAEGTSVLTNYLKRKSKRYEYYYHRFGDMSNACIKARVKFWNDHIDELEAKGM